jgi:hypothetical protein
MIFELPVELMISSENYFQLFSIIVSLIISFHSPLASLAVSKFRHAIMIRAPLFAKSLAVSFPIPLKFEYY